MAGKMTPLAIVIGLTIGVVVFSVIARASRLLDEMIAPIDTPPDELQDVLKDIEDAFANRSDNNMPDNMITMVVSGDTAYWIENNVLMKAPVGEDGEVDFSQEVRYNAIDAPQSELKQILSILDTIKENT